MTKPKSDGKQQDPAPAPEKRERQGSQGKVYVDMATGEEVPAPEGSGVMDQDQHKAERQGQVVGVEFEPPRSERTPTEGGEPQEDSPKPPSREKPGTSKGDVVFTEEQQNEVNRIVQSRLERARTAWEKERLESESEPESEAEEEKEPKPKSKPKPKPKATPKKDEQEGPDEIQERIAALESQLEQANSRAVQRELDTHVIREATALGFRDPGDAINLLPAEAVTEMLTQVGEGKKPESLKDALLALGKSKSYLLNRSAMKVVNPAATEGPPERTDEDRRKDYFGGKGSDFFGRGNLVLPREED